ncbi:MAG: type II toxin-antitoxin system HicA family toxin [Microcoleaceae cyanobacterium]
MPKKIRELKSMLRKAGFIYRSAKGSHTRWVHPLLPSQPITIRYLHKINLPFI